MNRYPEPLIQLITALKQLPGVGSRTAERYAFQMLTWEPARLKEFAKQVHALPTAIHSCSSCGCLQDESGCAFCTPNRQESGFLCVVASPRDVFSLESTGEYKGLYHVLEGLLSPMDGYGPDQLRIDKLKDRIKAHSIQEVILAIDSTLEGDATALFLHEELEPLSVNITRLAFGIPMGSSLDYVDGGTLTRALQGRIRF